MNAAGAASERKYTREQLREAAVWMTLLHGADRNPKLDRGFRRWLKADSRHAAAFETISTAWETTAGLPLIPLATQSHADQLSSRSRERASIRAKGRILALAASLLVVFGAGYFAYLRYFAGFSTGIGEQRILTLDDGTRVTLNTESRIVVQYKDTARLVDLKFGEALFDVAKDSRRPFTVSAGGRKITALGTTFNVRRDDSQLAITLLEGKVAVSGKSEKTSSEVVREANVVLAPGQRLTFFGGASSHTSEMSPPQQAGEGDEGQTSPVIIDRPSIDRVTAWRSGYVDLDGVRLADAIAELNRYSKTKLVVESPGAAAVPITGVFRAGDNEDFARAIAHTFGLRIRESGTRIVLEGSPN